MSERWRPVPGYHGAYEVSDQGRVRSWKVYRGKPGPRILKGVPKVEGHLNVGLVDAEGRVRFRMIHALVLEAFVGPRPEWAEESRHLDGDPANNALANLRYGTRSENQLDSVRHGTHHMARKTHCANGHEFTPENTRRYLRLGSLRRACLACERERRGGDLADTA